MPTPNEKQFELVLSEQELTLINNALNVVCNGVHIDDFEFATRLGGERPEVKAVLRRVNELLRGVA